MILTAKFRIVDLEQKLAGIADLPEHRAVGFDDVLVSGQHLPATAWLAAARRGRQLGAELDLIDLRHLGQEHGFDRVGEVDVQPGLGRRHPLAEAQHDALFVGLDAIERSRKPANEDDGGKRRNSAPAKARQAEKVAEARAHSGPGIKRRRGKIVVVRFSAHGGARPSGGNERAPQSCPTARLSSSIRRARALSFSPFALELAASGENVAPARRAHRGSHSRR